MKVLSIGNSFSQDTTAYLQRICRDAYVRNLYIGGCSLETHAQNLASEIPAYELMENDSAILSGVSANDVIAGERWDYITVQQASVFSGVKESYEPHLTFVLAKLRELCPTAKIVFHQTWAYAKEHMPFDQGNYGGSRELMKTRIEEAVAWAAEKHGLLPTTETDEQQSYLTKAAKSVVTAQYRFVKQEAELEHIRAVLEREGIAYVPLKGAVMRALYAEPWMRTSCDIDVLVHETDLERAVEAYNKRDRRFGGLKEE